MGRPREFDESHVLEAVRDAFWRSGFAATSMDDVTVATGLGKGSLYAAFGDKRALFTRVLDDYCAEAIGETRERLEGTDEGAYERLRTYLFASAANAAPAGARRGCLLAKAGAELAGVDDEIAQRTRATYEALEKVVVACIRSAQRHGDIAASANPRKLGALLFATLRGMEALGKGGVTAASLRRVAEAAIESLPRP